jgi:hypothetical protein
MARRPTPGRLVDLHVRRAWQHGRDAPGLDPALAAAIPARLPQVAGDLSDTAAAAVMLGGWPATAEPRAALAEQLARLAGAPGASVGLEQAVCAKRACGYRRRSFTRASAVVNVQATRPPAALRSPSHAAHSASGDFGQLPLRGVWISSGRRASRCASPGGDVAYSDAGDSSMAISGSDSSGGRA